MKKTLLSSFFIGLFFVTSSFASSNDSMLKTDEIQSLISGKRVYLKIPLGGEFPLRFASDGAVFGDGSAVGLGRIFAPKDKGRWWVDDNQLCQKWEKWYDEKTFCFQLSDLKGKELKWLRDDGRKGRARIE